MTGRMRRTLGTALLALAAPAWPDTLAANEPRAPAPSPHAPAQGTDPRAAAFLGIQPADHEEGVAVEEVVPGGPADRAGLKAGDVIQQLDGRDLSRSSAFVQRIGGRFAGEIVTLSILRESRNLDLAVTLGARAAEERFPQNDPGWEDPDAPPGPWQPLHAVDYLLKAQRPDGSWAPGQQVNPDAMGGITVATTALACRALLDRLALRPDAAQPAIRKGLEFVLKKAYRREDVRGSYAGFGSPQWGLIYTMELLADLVGHSGWKDERKELLKELNGAVGWLLKYQNARGGWGYDGSFKIGAAVLALQRAKAAGAEVDAKRLARAVAWLKAMRVEGRGYAYSQGAVDYLREWKETKAVNDGVGRLVECELAMLQAEEITPKDLQASFKLFMAHRDFLWKMRALAQEGKYPRNGGASPYCWFAFFGYYYSTLGLLSLPADARGDWAAVLRKDLMDRVERVGAWTNVDFPGGHPPPGSRIYATAMALLSLSHLDAAERPSPPKP